MTRFVAIVIVAGMVSACRSAPACPAELKVDAAAALREHTERQQRWTSLKAEARVTQWADRGRIRGTVLMFLQRPGRVRFDVMTQFGPAAVLTSDGESFQLADLRENVFLAGPTCAENIARLLGIAVESESVLKLLSGDTPILDASTAAMECQDGEYVVTLAANDGSTQEIAFAIEGEDLAKPPGAQRVTLRRSSVRGPDGEPLWDATYGDYTEVDGLEFPTDVRFVDHVQGADTQVRVKSLAVDPEVPSDAFRQEPSPAMKVEYAACP